MTQEEVIVFRSADNANIQIEVKVEDDTVWLTQVQMVELFDTSKQNISLHINNIFKEGELTEDATVKEFLTVQTEGSRRVQRRVAHYNLDVIISVGYRVKSLRGTQFRIWANKVLKDYLLKGYALHHRVERIEKKLLKHEEMFDLYIHSNIPGKEGIFYDGQIFDAHVFFSQIVKSASRSVVLIDNYIDESVFVLLSKRNINVTATIYTANISKQLRLDIEKFNAQYTKIDVKVFTQSHDRFLIIDNQTVYHIGASLKDLGKKWFAFSKIAINANEMISKLAK